MQNIGAPELIIVLIVLLLVVGPGKLPEIGSASGKTLREFRKASSEIQGSVDLTTGSAQQANPATATGQPSGPASVPNVITSAADPDAVGVARNVSPRGTPEDAITTD